MAIHQSRNAVLHSHKVQTPPSLPPSRINLVAQEGAGQTPEGVQVEEAAGQIDQLELFHLSVDENLSGGEGRNPGPGGVGHIDACGGGGGDKRI